jgi:putative ABC transport system permease protein
LLAAQAAEFLALGAMAGLFAATGATALGWVLAEFVLKLPYAFNPWIWPAGIAAGALGVAAAGLLGTRRVLDHPPLAALRRLT